jgi:hypothetical protein
MTTDTNLDGNALGGLLYEVFGREMTDQSGCCNGCGTVSVLGSVMLFRGAGDVVRCPSCGAVLIVIVSTPAGLRVSFESIRWLAIEDPALARV